MLFRLLQLQLSTSDFDTIRSKQLLDDSVTDYLGAKSPATARAALERTNFEQPQKIAPVIDAEPAKEAFSTMTVLTPFTLAATWSRNEPPFLSDIF